MRPLGGYFADSGAAAAPHEGRWHSGNADIAAAPGTLLRVRTPGAGGWGAAFARDPEAVLRDVRDGFVTPGGARVDYGVVILGDVDAGPDELTVDREATEALRRDAVRRSSTTEDGS